MLDPHPDRKGLGLDMDPALVKLLEGVAGRMADRQNDVLGRQELTGREVQAFELPALHFEILDPGAEAVFAAQLLDRLTDRHDHGDQPEGADVRVGLGQDVLGRAGLDEFGQDLARKVAGILDPRIELAVGKGSGAALAELDVRFRFKHRSPPQPPGILGPLAHRLAALDHDRAEAHLRQDQRGQQPAGARPDHHRARSAPALGRHHRKTIGGIGAGSDVRITRVPGQHRGLVRHHGIERIDQLDRRLLARIVAAPGDAEPDELLRADPQLAPQRRLELFGGMVKRQGQVGHADHRPGPSRSGRAGKAASRQAWGGWPKRVLNQRTKALGLA